MFWLEIRLLAGEKARLILIFQQNTVLVINSDNLSAGLFTSIWGQTDSLDVGGSESERNLRKIMPRLLAEQDTDM